MAENEFQLLKNPSELIGWLEENDILMNISKEDSGILFNYMEGHGYQLGSIGNELARSDSCSGESAEYEKLTIDEIIDSVCEWNYEMLQNAKEKLQEPSNFIDFVKTSNYLDSLKEDEKKLDVMFNKTCFGKEVEELAQKLAMEAIRNIQTERSMKGYDEYNNESKETDKDKEKMKPPEQTTKVR